MTLADVTQVMAKAEPAWGNGHNWMRERIVSVMETCLQQNKKFIWAIGGKHLLPPYYLPICISPPLSRIGMNHPPLHVFRFVTEVVF
jgi:hypothetical protein